MIHSRRLLSCLLALPALSLSAVAAPLTQDVAQDFAQGKTALEQGRKADALQAFQRVLAADPSNEVAYQLWKDTDHEIWLQMLVEGGEYALVAQRLMERGRLARADRMNDADAIRGLVATLRNSSDVRERRTALDALGTNHGDYAVPYLISALADVSNADWRVIAMTSLSDMGPVVVPPLIEALDASDAFLARNVALTLGYLGDPRAAGPLAALAQSASDGMVVTAAGEAAAKCGSNGSALAQLLQDGEDYHYRRDNVLPPYAYSAVVWSWDGRELQSETVPRALYNNELSKKAYYRALMVAPDSVDARAGVARAAIDILAKLEILAAQGGDVSDLQAKAEVGGLAIALAGADALDLALQWSVLNDDVTSGAALCGALAELAEGPTEGLRQALQAPDGGVRGEAAVALAHLAIRSGSAPSADVVASLGQNAGREVVRMVALLDGNAERARALTDKLSGMGISVSHRASGASGLEMLRRTPGVDLILVGDQLGGLTFDAVLVDVANNAATTDVPTFLLTSDSDLGDAYSDRVGGVVASADDLSPLDDVLAATLKGGRAQANDLAGRSAAALSALASAGADLSSTIEALASMLTGMRPDGVVTPALDALASAGNASVIAAVLSTVQNADRSDAVRAAAASALGGILGRGANSADAVAALRDLASSSAPLAVRAAAARALGRAGVPAADRAATLLAARVTVSE
jgi:HEAT repeat protein